jgi:hypothetical protein
MIKAIVMTAKAISIALLAILVTSCQQTISFGNGIKGSGNVVTQNRNITEKFTGIDAGSGIEVEITQANTPSILVEADDNIIEYITTEIQNGILIISCKESIKNAKERKVKVTLPDVESISASSGSEIKSMNTITSSSLDIKSSSGSEIDITIQAENAYCTSSSGSTINLKGKALKLQTQSSSGSDIDAEDLLANEINATSSSGSHTTIHPIVSLEASASSGGNINYVNVPKSVSKKESSGGSISN